MTTPVRPRLKLPLGIQNLREIREAGHYYVDKSGMAVDLIEAGKYYFLSRPRRFGKSLLVDTFKELFEGNRALFEGRIKPFIPPTGNIQSILAGSGRHKRPGTAGACP